MNKETECPAMTIGIKVLLFSLIVSVAIGASGCHATSAQVIPSGTVTVEPLTFTKTATATEIPTETPKPTVTPLPSITPTETAKPTSTDVPLPRVETVPVEFKATSVKEVDGGIYGLNALGVATTKYENGKWVEYVAPIYVMSWSDGITKDIPTDMQKELTPQEVYRIKVTDKTTNDVVFGQAFHFQKVDIEGSISADEQGNLDYGLIWEVTIGFEDNGVSSSVRDAFVSANVLGVFESDGLFNNGKKEPYLLIDIPSALSHQELALPWPNQRNGFYNGLMMPEESKLQDLKTSTFRNIGLNWDEWLKVLKHARGQQVLIGLQEVYGQKEGDQPYSNVVIALKKGIDVNYSNRWWTDGPSFAVIPESLIKEALSR